MANSAEIAQYCAIFKMTGTDTFECSNYGASVEWSGNNGNNGVGPGCSKVQKKGDGTYYHCVKF